MIPGGGGMALTGGGMNGGLCKWAVPTGGGTLGSKGIRANGARAAGVGPLMTGNGGVAGVLSNGCLRGNAPATGGTAAGNRGADCCAILLLLGLNPML